MLFLDLHFLAIYFQQYFSYIVAVSYIGAMKPEYPEKKY
jgi:hypothetical protein